MSDETEILAANARFYDAFAKKDIDAMESVWARELPVACIHPGWTALRGRVRVLASFRGILSNPESPDIRCVDPTVFHYGDAAFVICYEAVENGRLLATNVFAREDGNWRMVHHQAGPTSSAPSERPPPNPSSLN
jgi:ketosteroid isomerase-like protein